MKSRRILSGIRSIGLEREGIVGIGLLILCLIYYLFTLKPAHMKLLELQNSVASLKNRIETTSNEAPAQQLASYYSFFPSQDALPDLLQTLYGAASEHKVRIIQSSYRVSHANTERLVRYSISMPVRGNYLKIRRFLSDVLAAIPAASLDHISFEREKIGDAVVSAEIRLTFYLGEME